jgi:hypothetical protein
MKAMNCALGLLVAAGLAAAARADEAATRATLKDLGSVRLVVSDLGRVVESQGLKKQDLYAAVEKRLRAAGIALLGEGERARGMPTLFLNLVLADADDAQTTYVYSLDLTLSQEVRLVRAPGIIVNSPTWKSAGAVGVVENDKLGLLQEATNQAADAFIAAYRAANTAK